MATFRIPGCCSCVVSRIVSNEGVSIQTRVTDEAVDGISASLCPVPEVHHTDTANNTIPPIHTTTTQRHISCLCRCFFCCLCDAAPSSSSSLNESTYVQTDAHTACAAAATPHFCKETSFSTSSIFTKSAVFTADSSLHSVFLPAANLTEDISHPDEM